MKRVHAFVSGEVQGVGYREEVKRIAFGLDIFGWVRNLEDGRVELIAEGEDKKIEEFLNRINVKKYPIFVVNIEVEENSYKKEFGSFKIIRDKDVQKEMLSALSRGTVDIHEVKEILQSVKHDTSAMLEKQDKMLEKQETTIQILKSVKEDTGEMKSSLAGIGVDIKDTKFSLSSFIEEKFRKQEIEIAEIKATLARIQEVIRAA